MEAEEVVVDLAPETDFGEMSVEEETPPVVEEPEKPAGDEPTEKPAEETPPVKPKEPDEEVERIRKDNASLGYNLRETQRRLKFIEDQLQQEREKNEKRQLNDEHSIALSKIEHLRELDPDAYIKERERLIEQKYRKEQEQEREALKTRSKTEDAAARRQRVEEQLHQDFPEILNQSSELFTETRKGIEGRYSPEEIAHIVANTPQVFYDIVKEANARLRIKQLENEKANLSREQRVAGQGAVVTQPKSTAAAVKLTKEQMQFCKDNGFKPEDYAKFLGKGRK